VRLATFNILHGRSLHDGAVDVQRFAQAVKELDADVLALQEVDRDQPRSGGVDLTALAAKAMGAQAHRFVAALSGTPGSTWMAATGQEQPGTASYGIALLSRYPVRSWQVVRLPPLKWRVPLYIRDARRLIVTSEEPRVAVAAVVDSPVGDLTVANTHLSFVPGWNVLQLRRLRRDLASLPGTLVLMGDLNLPDGRPERITGYRPLVREPTFPAHEPQRQLDHVLLRGKLGGRWQVDGRALQLPVSDHRALVVDVQRTS
jgi:endonuclease/exonuclease/phosphatase family metal-dependent hydrolase